VQCLDAHHDLGEGERLGDVVVATGVEASDLVVHGVECGEEEDRGVLTFSAQRLADVATVGVGKPDVDHQDVDARTDGEVAECLLTVASDDDVVSVHPERVCQDASY